MAAGSGRSRASFGLGLFAAAVSWSPIGVLGIAAGIAALVIGSNEGKGPEGRRPPLATAGMLLGAAGIAIAVGIAIYGIAHSIANGTFDTG